MRVAPVNDSRQRWQQVENGFRHGEDKRTKRIPARRAQRSHKQAACFQHAGRQVKKSDSRGELTKRMEEKCKQAGVEPDRTRTGLVAVSLVYGGARRTMHCEAVRKIQFCAAIMPTLSR